MSKNTFRSVAWYLVIPIITALCANSSTPEGKLHQVRKIYVAKEEQYEVTEKFIAREKHINYNLKKELARNGFIITDELLEADAILSGSFGDIIVLDGPQPDPPEYHYEYQLTSRGKQRLWRTEFSIRSKAGDVDADEKAARRIVEKLVKAWQESRRK
jgi:hypothetical protein